MTTNCPAALTEATLPITPAAGVTVTGWLDLAEVPAGAAFAGGPTSGFLDWNEEQPVAPTAQAHAKNQTIHRVRFIMAICRRIPRLLSSLENPAPPCEKCLFIPPIPTKKRAVKLTWKDHEEIAWALADKYPGQDPLRLSFPKLRQMVCDLKDFGDPPEASNERVLENIQMAWVEEMK